MFTVRLSMEPRFSGPFSVGTVEVVRLVCEHARLGLSDGKRLVDRCVFEGEPVLIPMPSEDAAAALMSALLRLTDSPELLAVVEV
jgi:hypothetical protein